MASSISVKVVAAGATLLSELYDNANRDDEHMRDQDGQNILGAHEGLAVEICYSILGVLPTIS
jgi:hypothetical protein